VGVSCAIWKVHGIAAVRILPHTGQSFYVMPVIFKESVSKVRARRHVRLNLIARQQAVRMTSDKENELLRCWAIVALALMAIVYVLPHSILEMLVVRPDTNILLRIAVAVILLVGVLGFYLRMFFECAFVKGVHNRGKWLLLFVFFPILPAFIYFFVTRSVRYRNYISGQ
jgi:hypothetical protein